MKKFTAVILMTVMLISVFAFNVSAETDVSSDGLMLWLKSDSGITADDDGNVSVWADSSGKGNDLVQTESDSRRPLIAESEYLRGGQKSVHFETNRYLASGAVEYLGSSTLILYYKPDYAAKNQTIFSSARYKGSATRTEGKVPFTLTNSGSDTDGVYLTMAGAESGTTTYATKVPQKSDGYMTLMITIDSTTGTVNVYQNDSGDNKNVTSALTSFAMDAIPYYDAFALGLKYDTSIRTRGMLGEVAEMLVYNRVLGSEELNNVNKYLKTKYDIPKTVKGLKIQEQDAVMFVGDTTTPNVISVADIMGSEVEAEAKDVTFESSDEQVVSINNGQLCAVSPGKSIITASCGDSVKASYIVYVPNVKPAEPTVSNFSQGGEMSVTVPITTYEASEAAVFAAIYKGDVLVDFKYTDEAENDAFTLGFDMPEDISEYKTVIMVVASSEDLTPIAQFEAYPQQ